jgi:membrane peptidoglycan carboxypeptidase
MKDNGWYDKNRVRQHISQDEYDLATKEELEFVKNTGIINAPHFVMYVLNLLNEKYGDDIVQKSGFSVKTSLDLGLQKEFEKIAQEEVAKAKTLDLSNAALVAIDPKTRGVLAMVGSIDYNSNEIDGKFNVATGYRQPGSTLKPITYLTALNQGYTASSVFYDVSTEFKVDGSTPIYEPKNYGGWGFRGPIQMRYALANSVNVTAVKTLDLVGIQNMVDTANSLGLNFKYDSRKHGLAITLGGGEVRLLDLANTYASLAAGGKYKDVNPILEIKSPDGQLIEKVIENEGTQVVDSRNVWIITDILSDNNARAMAFGTGSQLAFKGNKVAVKTGTSNDLKDNWTVGFTPDIAIGVWVGIYGTHDTKSEPPRRL